MTKLDELRKAIEKTNRTQTFAESLLFDDSTYFVKHLFGQSKTLSNQALAVMDAIEKAGVRQTLAADEKELLSGIICNAFTESLKCKVNGTIARASKFFELLENAMKESREFSEIIVTYLDDVMMEPVKLVVDDDNTLTKIAMWIVVRTVMIPITPMKADATASSPNNDTSTTADETKSESGNVDDVKISTDDTGRVVVDVEYTEVESKPETTDIVVSAANNTTSDESPKSAANKKAPDVVTERNDAIVKAVKSLKDLGIPDDKIYSVLGINMVSSTSEGGTIVKASTSYRDTSSEKAIADSSKATAKTKPKKKTGFEQMCEDLEGFKFDFPWAPNHFFG